MELDPNRQWNQKDAVFDELMVREVHQEHSLSLRFWVISWAFHSSHDVVSFCALLKSSLFYSDDDRTRTHKVYRTARVCLENVVWVSNSRKMFDDNKDILVAHLFQLHSVQAFSAEYCYVVMRLTMSVKLRHFVSLNLRRRGRIKGRILNEIQKLNEKNCLLCFKK